MMKKTDLFFAVMMRGVLGGVIGILSGFVLGMLIWTLIQVSVMLAPGSLNAPGDMVAMVSLMSMGFGAVLGAFIGSQVAFKEKK